MDIRMVLTNMMVNDLTLMELFSVAHWNAFYKAAPMHAIDEDIRGFIEKEHLPPYVIEFLTHVSH